MKNKLQYAYSILVFLGVLVASYLMMDREGVARMPIRVYQGPYFRTEAITVDPALNQLLEMERALRKAREQSGEKRGPTFDEGWE